MNTTLTTEVDLADAVYAMAEIARKADPQIERVYVETSDQGEWMLASSVTFRGGDEEANDGLLDEQIDADAACALEDWAMQLSWDAAKYGVATGWVTVNARGGYYYIDVDEALKAQPPVEIKPVDLVSGVLALHIAQHRPLLSDEKTRCSCGETVDDLIAFRQHVAEKVVEVLS